MALFRRYKQLMQLINKPKKILKMGKRFEKRSYQSRYTNGKKTHEKMVNIASY